MKQNNPMKQQNTRNPHEYIKIKPSLNTQSTTDFESTSSTTLILRRRSNKECGCNLDVKEALD